MKKVFISHSSKDKKLIEHIFNFLHKDIFIAKTNIYCTSRHSILPGEDFISSIKKGLDNAGIVLFIITENYMKSNFCMMEMGAAWAIQSNIIPITIPPCSHKSLESTPLQTRQTVMIDDVDGMESVFGQMFFRLGIIDEVDQDIKNKIVKFINNLNANDMYRNAPSTKNDLDSKTVTALKYYNTVINDLITKADQGDKIAQYSLAVYYSRSSIMPVNYEKAYDLAIRSAKQGYIPAYDLVGRFYYRGTGIDQNFKEAFSWLKKAADNGSVVSCGQLAFMYRVGLGTPRNFELAEIYYNKTIEFGSDAYDYIGDMHYEQGDRDKALNYYSNSKNENVTSLLRMGNIYYWGSNLVKPNYETASEYYKQAADNGSPDAMFRLGNMYYYGHWGHDFDVSLHWYKKGADLGHAESQYTLGYFYLHGLGTSINEDAAIYWFKKSAEQGVCLSQMHLGNLYLRGTSTMEPNYAKAVYWTHKAAQQGEPESQRLLGDMYMYGVGCVKDVVEARKWYQKASNKGDVLALLALDTKFCHTSESQN